MVGAGLATLGIGGYALKKGLLNKFKPMNATKSVVTKPKIKEADFFDHLKKTYSQHIPWQDDIGTKSAYVAGEREFAKKLLENIDNEEEFMKIYNSDFMHPGLANTKLDKKYDVIEELYGIPLDLAVNFDKFNIKGGSMTDRVHRLMQEWYRDGVKEVKLDTMFEVKNKEWDRVRDALQRSLR